MDHRARRFLLSLTTLLVIGCQPDPIRLRIDNRGGHEHAQNMLKTNFLTNTKSVVEVSTLLQWDVAVAVSGQDFGVIEGGTTSEVETLSARELVIDDIEIQTNDAGQAVYAVVQSADEGRAYYENARPGDKVYVDLDALVPGMSNEDVTKVAELYRSWKPTLPAERSEPKLLDFSFMSLSAARDRFGVPTLEAPAADALRAEKGADPKEASATAASLEAKSAQSSAQIPEDASHAATEQAQESTDDVESGDPDGRNEPPPAVGPKDTPKQEEADAG